MKLLLRFYDQKRGRITVDGDDLRELDPDELRANIAAVLQETLRLDGTVGENILAGAAGADRDRMVAAARAADADAFIRALPYFFQAEDGIRDIGVTGVQTCALPI